MNYVAALATHFCLALPATFTQPGDTLLAKPCVYDFILEVSFILRKHSYEGPRQG